MAERNSSGLQEKLTCQICQSIYKNPKQLQCLHTFCAQCLKQLQRRTKLREQMRCPLCKCELSLVDTVSIEALSAPYYISRLQSILNCAHESLEMTCNSCDRHTPASSYCYNCKCLVCDDCIEIHNHMKIMRDHRIIDLKDTHLDDLREIVQGMDNCMRRKHENECLVGFCKTCSECVCEKCKSAEHVGHEILEIETAQRECTAEIIQGLDRLEEKTKSCEVAVETLNASYNSAVKKLVAARKSVHENVSRLVSILRDHERKVVTELDHLQINLRQSIFTDENEFEAKLQQMRSTTQCVFDVINRGIDKEILNSHRVIDARVEDLLAVPTSEVRDRRVNIDYKSNAEIEQFLESSEIGRLSICYTDPACSEVVSENLDEAITSAGERMIFEVFTKDSDGNRNYSEDDNIEVYIESNNGRVVHSHIEDKQDGSYMVAYTPLRSGTYDIEVKVRGEQIRGSPFKMYVATRAEYLQVSRLSLGLSGSFENCAPLISLGCLDTEEGSDLKRPCGIAVNGSDVIAVADSWNHQVRVLGLEGRTLRILGKDKNSNAALLNPIGVCFDGEDNILVSDSEKQMIYTFSPTGECINSFGGKSLKYPWGIHVCYDGTILIADWGARSVKKFSSKRKYIDEFKSPEISSSGKPPRPCYVTENKTKYLVSYDNNTIQVFDKTGYHLYSLGCSGHGEGRFKDPRGLCVDAQERLLVCDSGNHRIQILSPDGSFRVFGTYGKGVGEFDRPQDVAVSRDGLVIVTDMQNNRVQVLRQAELSLSKVSLDVSH